jgi:hypothetical protein
LRHRHRRIGGDTGYIDGDSRIVAVPWALGRRLCAAAEQCLNEAIVEAAIDRSQIATTFSNGYGGITCLGRGKMTEIACHGKGPVPFSAATSR